jgi:hypothetical protein
MDAPSPALQPAGRASLAGTRCADSQPEPGRRRQARCRTPGRRSAGRNARWWRTPTRQQWASAPAPHEPACSAQSNSRRRPFRMSRFGPRRPLPAASRISCSQPQRRLIVRVVGRPGAWYSTPAAGGSGHVRRSSVGLPRRPGRHAAYHCRLVMGADAARTVVPLASSGRHYRV